MRRILNCSNESQRKVVDQAVQDTFPYSRFLNGAKRNNAKMKNEDDDALKDEDYPFGMGNAEHPGKIILINILHTLAPIYQIADRCVERKYDKWKLPSREDMISDTIERMANRPGKFKEKQGGLWVEVHDYEQPLRRFISNKINKIIKKEKKLYSLEDVLEKVEKYMGNDETSISISAAFYPVLSVSLIVNAFSLDRDILKNETMPFGISFQSGIHPLSRPPAADHPLNNQGKDTLSSKKEQLRKSQGKLPHVGQPLQVKPNMPSRQFTKEEFGRSFIPTETIKFEENIYPTENIRLKNTYMITPTNSYGNKNNDEENLETIHAAGSFSTPPITDLYGTHPGKDSSKRVQLSFQERKNEREACRVIKPEMKQRERTCQSEYPTFSPSNFSRVKDSCESQILEFPYIVTPTNSCGTSGNDNEHLENFNREEPSLISPTTSLINNRNREYPIDLPQFLSQINTDMNNSDIFSDDEMSDFDEYMYDSFDDFFSQDEDFLENSVDSTDTFSISSIDCSLDSFLPEEMINIRWNSCCNK